MEEKKSQTYVKEDKPYVQTYSIVAGSLACNARCPYCVSKMTPTQGVTRKLPEVNWRNFDLGAKLAREWGAATALITSKGEATLYPEQITDFMVALNDHGYPMVELQTNGINLAKESYTKHLKDWYDMGMTTVALSVAHYDTQRNKEIYEPHNDNVTDLEGLVKRLHDNGLSVRLSVIMLKDYIDSVEEMDKMVDFAKRNNVEQLTIRSVDRPGVTANEKIATYVDQHMIDKKVIDDIRDFLDENGTRLRELVHGAIVYDYKGQNLCLANCLTTDAKDNSIRQLIFFPDGHVRYDWQHEGAVLF